MSQTILVTGSGGFLGRHIVRDLVERGFKTESKMRADGDVCVEETWETYPSTNCLIHLAGSTFIPDSWNSPAKFIRSNSLSTAFALDYCRKHNAKFIFFSSYMYEKSASIPVSEDSKLSPANPYSLSKLVGEKLCAFYSEHFGVDVVILRPFNVYGIGQNSKFLIPSIIEQARKSDVIYVQNSKPSRDYIYIEDLLSAVTKVITMDIKFNIFNLGTGVSFSVKGLIDVLGSVLGRNLTLISPEIERTGEINFTQADVTRAREVLGWSSSWTLHDGLAALWNKSF